MLYIMDPTGQNCRVCNIQIHSLATLCKRCKKFVDRIDIRSKPNKEARIKALAQAWDGEGFRCHYSGILLNESNHKDPRYLTFDHRLPRQEDDIVVTAACFNDMKSDMSENEFRNVVIELASKFKGGGFDEKVLRLKHWKR